MARVLFIQKRQAMQQDYIGIMQISSVLKHNGHQCDLLITPHLNKKNMDEIREYKPDLIGLSVMTVENAWYQRLASQIKQSGIQAPIIAGGAHPTYFPDYIKNDGIDMINIGEGEFSMLDLANAIDKQEDYRGIQNLYVKMDGTIYRNNVRPLVDINTLPPLDRDLYLKFDFYRRQNIFQFYTSRGCPFNCSFCYSHVWKSFYKDDPNRNKVRIRKIDSIIQEIKYLSTKVKISKVLFIDSTFNIDKEWTKEFLQRYGREVKIPFAFNLRLDLINEDIIRTIAETQCCYMIFIGVEVGKEEARKRILDKDISNEEIIKIFDLARQYQIRTLAYTMYGLPGETLDGAYETVTLMQKLQPYTVAAQICHLYPGLILTQKALQDGIISESDLEKFGNINFPLRSILQQPGINDVTNLMKLSMIAIRHPKWGSFIKRLATFRPNILFDIIYIISSMVVLKKSTSRGNLTKD